MDRNIIILTMIEKEKELLSGAFPNKITKHDNVYKHNKIDKWKNNNWKRQEVGPVNKMVLQMTIMPTSMSEIMAKF